VDELLDDERFTADEDNYVSAILTDPVRPQDPMRTLQTRFPHMVHLEWQRPEGSADLHYGERVHGRSDLQIATSFLTDMRGEPTVSELRLVERALSAAVRENELGEPAALEEIA